VTLITLRSREEIVQARKMLRVEGLSCEPQGVTGLFFRMGLRSTAALGGWLKSWDVQKTAEFASENLQKEQPLLDIGAYASEILCVLSKMGFEHLNGIDLNPDLDAAASKTGFQSRIADYYDSGYPDRSFRAVTAISVIEHGFRETPLCREVSRLLVPGGYFVASFDYWPEKLDTSDVSLFGMDWRIFSKEDVRSLLKTAADHGLSPVGNVDLDAVTPVVQWAGRSYTFAWMALRKKLTGVTVQSANPDGRFG